MAAPRQVGELDELVRILRASSAASEFGERVEHWTPEATQLHAKRDDGAGDEAPIAGEVAAAMTARFWVRWSRRTASITVRDRLRFDGRDYAITAALDIGRREWRSLDCVARAEGLAGDTLTETGETA